MILRKYCSGRSIGKAAWETKRISDPLIDSRIVGRRVNSQDVGRRVNSRIAGSRVNPQIVGCRVNPQTVGQIALMGKQEINRRFGNNADKYCSGYFLIIDKALFLNAL